MRSPDEIRAAAVGDWIESARVDLAWAEMGARSDELGIAPIGFHAQQAVEKLLKGLLAAYDVVPEEKHEIGPLVAQVRLLERSTADSLPAVTELTRYAVQYRYPPRPGRSHLLQRDDVIRHLAAAREACVVLERAIGERMAALSRRG